MVTLQLFSQETKALLKKEEDLFKDKFKPKPKTTKGKKKKATITLEYSNYATDIYKNYKNGVGIGNPLHLEGDRFVSVDFMGYNEGSWGGFDEDKVEEEIIKLETQYNDYSIKIIDDEKIRYNYLLNKWKEFIINLCKEKGQEIDKIWFDNSVPYDCEIGIRLVGHRCWNFCVSFRFEKGDLRAFDSHFGGGTSFLRGFGREKETDEEIGTQIKEIMERVFNKECSNSSWEDNEREYPLRVIEVDEKGWIING